jgi:hypothetical protein
MIRIDKKLHVSVQEFIAGYWRNVKYSILWDLLTVVFSGRTVWTGTTAELTPAVTDRYLGV